MNEEPPSTVTRLLDELRAGDSSAFNRLLPFVYQDLKERAHAQRRRWEGDQTLNTTALLNEAYLKLATAAKPDWENRAHFLAVAAKAMRRILIDYARIRRAEKRGGDRVQVTLDKLNLDPGPNLSSERAEALLALDRSLERLSGRNERQSRTVECRFFGGMTIPDTAEALGISLATVQRDWAMAKVWLYRDMQRALGD
ncbi:MAG: sigma-70 family RNA polymerase sigma factor [Gemmatimonadota bacterium]